MTRKKVVKRVKLKKWVRFSILAVVFIIFCSGVLVIRRGFSLEKTKEDAKILYAYNMYQNLDYKVYLNKNSFIDKEFLPKGESYISDLIKNIKSKNRKTVSQRERCSHAGSRSTPDPHPFTRGVGVLRSTVRDPQ